MNGDLASLIVINSVSGIVLGLAITVAVDVLPGPRWRRVMTHWVVLAGWTIVLMTITIVVGDPAAARVARRWMNAVALFYVAGLLIAHARQSPWRKERIKS
jgi:predicted membrane channel-forming protein YqfA (hemolysin III family)